MIGAIVGDIVGSRFEFNNYRSKDFNLFDKSCFATDDSIMTIAIAKAIMEMKSLNDLRDKAIYYMQKIGRKYPNCGYGNRFYNWIFSDIPKAYNSCGNGAAMRVSACGFAARTLDEAKTMSLYVTDISHNHPEGIKGAESIALAIFMARLGFSMSEIKSEMGKYYDFNFSIDEIRESYRFNEICQTTVPQALECFFESNGFEDAIRNAISIGGDSDTIGAITGAVAEAFYGVPKDIEDLAKSFLDDELLEIVEDFSYFLEKR